jgi:7-cyano-7-deazaguanine synthase
VKKAIILYSGGLDSTVMLAMALAAGRICYALSFDYQQRHAQELHAAKLLTAHYRVPHQIVKIDAPAFTTSALVSKQPIAQGRTQADIRAGGIPSTYVPARNALFLAFAMSQAEMVAADEIYFGCNALDYVPYVDCRPAFIEAFQAMMNLATKQAIEGHPPQLVTPLIELDKSAIVRKGIELNVPLALTWSCYSPTSAGKPCTLCDACRLRLEALEALNL